MNDDLERLARALERLAERLDWEERILSDELGLISEAVAALRAAAKTIADRS